MIYNIIISVFVAFGLSASRTTEAQQVYEVRGYLIAQNNFHEIDLTLNKTQSGSFVQGGNYVSRLIIDYLHKVIQTQILSH